MRLPCLVSDIPGNKEWITEGEQRLAIPQWKCGWTGDEDVAIIDQRKSLPEIGKAARAAAEERADWKKNSAKLMQAYATGFAIEINSGGSHGFSLILALAFAIVAVIFALQNTAVVTVTFFSLSFEGSLALVILVVVAVGILIGVLVMAPGRLAKAACLTRVTEKRSARLKPAWTSTRQQLSDI